MSECCNCQPKKMTDPGEILRKRRIVNVTGEFTEDMAEMVCDSLLVLEHDSSEKDILLVIESFGGSVLSCLRIIDQIKMLTCPVSTLVMGKAMSCGSILAVCGAPGKRFMGAHSVQLIHSLSSGVSGTVADMENDVKESKRLQEVLEGIYKKHTKLTAKQMKELMAKDSYITAADCVKWGMADAIVSDHKSLWGKLAI